LIAARNRYHDQKNYKSAAILYEGLAVALSHSAFLVIMDLNKHGHARIHLYPECDSAVFLHCVPLQCLDIKEAKCGNMVCHRAHSQFPLLEEMDWVPPDVVRAKLVQTLPTYLRKSSIVCKYDRIVVFA
jgi:hypothetical protein